MARNFNSVNKVILLGRLGKDPELKYIPSGAPVANFSIATDEVWVDKNNEKQKRTEWHRIVAWGKQAEFCGEYLSKGRLLYVEGRLRSRTWEDRNGNQRTTTEVNATDIVLLGRRPEEAPEEAQPETSEEEEITDEDIPF
ncbi:MAG: single-stranded DNA-binding protein [Candidatus Aminicenantes bacterium]|nr:single-stranded DNA-binding protein [Candidatus Aminicenantes bacterium]MDH5714353.1 single-stranded DNA-binding protein [Candidatus Aminicenantes bacterium]